MTTVIPEIDIWRAATLMLKRYGEEALERSRTRIDELAADGDHDGADTSIDGGGDKTRATNRSAEGAWHEARVWGNDDHLRMGQPRSNQRPGSIRTAL